MNTTTPWFRRCFGPYLQKYDPHSSSLISEPIEEIFVGGAQCVDCVRMQNDVAVAVYLVPLPDIETGRYVNADCTDELRKLYERLNERRECEHRKRLEVVQVCFPHRPPSANRPLDQNVKREFENRVANVPWFALPVDNFERSIRLRHRYGVHDGEFALVLLNYETGCVITDRGHDHLLREDRAIEFPWIPPNVLHILQKVPEYVSYRREEFVESTRSENSPHRTSCSFDDIGKDSIFGLYFSAHWCPPCRAFTSQLIKAYASIKQSGRKFEIIFISSDRSADSYAQYVSTMPWHAIPFENHASRVQLTNLFGIRGIPSLILLNTDGSIITEDGRGEINDDPQATNFPWFARPVIVLTPRIAVRLQKNPAVVLFIDGEEDGEIELATTVLAPVSQKISDEKRVEPLLFAIATDSETGESIREFLRLEDVSPLLTLVDIPLGRFAVMEYGKEITERTIMSFVKRFFENDLIFSSIEYRI